MMNRISWVTSDCFADCDFIYDVMRELCQIYSIRWIIHYGKNPRYSELDYQIFNDIENLEIKFVYNPYRQRDPRSIWGYWKVYKLAKHFRPDVYYFNMPPAPFYPFVSIFYDKNRSIYCAHDGGPQKDSVKNVMIHTWFFNQTYKYAKYVNMFSETQATLYHSNYPKGKVHVMRLALKDFGEPTIEKPTDVIRFLSVGYIIHQKNIDLLIEAGNKLYERGYRNFRISINGACDNWNFYKNKINYPEMFECFPGFRPNSELPNLYESSHYAVFPYRRVSQSGALKVAFKYNVPVIASNIGAFKEEIIEGKNGFFFDVGNLEDLTNLMEKLLNEHAQNYKNLRKTMYAYTNAHYSNEVLVKTYDGLFRSVIDKR